jgi:chloramphenicol 3-O-phosphotransferase
MREAFRHVRRIAGGGRNRSDMDMMTEDRPPAGQMILLNGASSSGKSSLARAVQATIDRPFWHISIDHLRDSGVLPSARIKSGEFAGGRCASRSSSVSSSRCRLICGPETA